MRWPAAILAALAAALMALAAPAPTLASPAHLTPSELRVAGGEGWRPTSGFEVLWERLAETPEPTLIEYRVRDGNGVAFGPAGLLPWTRDALFGVGVPLRPDRYTVELRLGDGASWGAWASAAVHFDNTRPGPVTPAAPDGWIGRRASPMLRIDHPAEPLPLSGIRGYAIAIGDRPNGHPCAVPPLCTGAETDLDGGTGDDELPLPALAEGVHYARAVAVSGAGVSSPTVGVAELRVDETAPEVALTGHRDGWQRGPVRLRAAAADRPSGMAPAGPAGPFTAIAVDGGPPTVAFGGSVEAVAAGDGVHRISFYGRDAAGNVGDGLLGAPPPRTALVRIDSTPPAVSFARAGGAGDPELLEAVVRDPLSGPAADRGWIGVRPAGADVPFAPLPTTVAPGGALRARWDSDSQPPGNYEFRATAYDRAGNRGDGNRRADGARLVLPSPLKRRVALRLGFGGRKMIWRRCARRGGKLRCRRETIAALGRRPTTRRMPYGRRVPVAAKLLGGGGAPLAGRSVTLVETLASGAVRARRARTGRDGRLFARLAPGPTRWVEARFGGDRTRSRAASRRLLLVVPSAVRMRSGSATAAVGGAPVRFRGRVGSLGAKVPGTGLQVELQFRLPGTPWTEFRTVRTDRRGRFRYAYAFSDDDSRGARFLFRAHVPAQEGWPYAAGSSRPATITGR